MPPTRLSSDKAVVYPMKSTRECLVEDFTWCLVQGAEKVCELCAQGLNSGSVNNRFFKDKEEYSKVAQNERSCLY